LSIAVCGANRNGVMLPGATIFFSLSVLRRRFLRGAGMAYS